MKNLLRSIVLELQQIVTHPRYILLLTVGIIFSYVFFLTFMSEGQPQKLPIAIVDQDGSYLSRRLAHEINATQGVRVVAVYNNHNQARDAMQRQKIFAFLEIPRGTYNDILSFRRPHISLYANNAYLLGGSFSYKSLATMTKLATGAIQREVLRKKGFSEQTIMGLIQPVELDTHSLSNPTTNYQPYILTTILPGIVGVMLLLLTIFQLQTWLLNPVERLKLCEGNLVAAIFGKLLPYSIWFATIGTLGNLVLFGIFKYTMLGHFWMLSLAMLLFILAVQSMGVFLVAVIPEMHMSISIGAIYGMLSFTLSGFSYPVSSMPGGMQAFAQIFPLRHYYLSYVDIALYDSPLMQYLPHFVSLLLFLLPGIFGGFLISRRLRREGVWNRIEMENIKEFLSSEASFALSTSLVAAEGLDEYPRETLIFNEPEEPGSSQEVSRPQTVIDRKPHQASQQQEPPQNTTTL